MSVCMYHPKLGWKSFEADEIEDLDPEWVDTPAGFENKDDMTEFMDREISPSSVAAIEAFDEEMFPKPGKKRSK